MKTEEEKNKPILVLKVQPTQLPLFSAKATKR